VIAMLSGIRFSKTAVKNKMEHLFRFFFHLNIHFVRGMSENEIVTCCWSCYPSTSTKFKRV